MNLIANKGKGIRFRKKNFDKDFADLVVSAILKQQKLQRLSL